MKTTTATQLEMFPEIVPVTAKAPVRAPVRVGRIFVLPLGARLDEEEGRCCEEAERVPCVCRASWKCADHGTTCHPGRMPTG